MCVCSKCGGSRVCECGGGNSNGNDVIMSSSGSKKQQLQHQKQKHPKIPKTDPGVLPATQRGNNEGFSILLSWPCPNSSVLHSHVPSFSPVIGSRHGNSGGGESSEQKLFRMNHAMLNESDGVSSYNDTNECYSDADWGSTLELNSDNVGTGHASFPQFVVSEIPPPAMSWSTSVHSDGYDGQPFFNFLEVKDEEELTEAGSNNDGIDLTLKL